MSHTAALASLSQQTPDASSCSTCAILWHRRFVASVASSPRTLRSHAGRTREGADKGDILTQRPVAISPDETALTLCTTCYAAGIEAFRELVEQRAAGTMTPTTLRSPSTEGRIR
jgi:hypothetical protein